MSQKTKVGLLIGAGLCLLGCACLGIFAVRWLPLSVTSGNTPAEMFEYLLLRPLPADVTDLQGGGYTWQGYSIWLRFRADEATLRRLITEEYESVDCAQILPQLTIDASAVTFQPAWQPEQVANAQCYWTPQMLSNAWTYGGRHYLLIDWETLEVYFYGIGG